MKLNKKGFMLAEVVIVATVITTVLVFLYISLNRMSNAYDTRNRYYDLDAMYAAMEINDILPSESFDSSVVPYYTSLIKNNGYQFVEEFADFYSNTGYNLNEVYYVKSNIVSLEKLNESISNENTYLKDYISYLKDNIEFDKYKYLIIVELEKKDADDVYFYTLKPKVGDTSETQS